MSFDEPEIYPERLKAAIADAMVMSIFFFRVGKSLIVDFRTADGVEPEVMVDPITASPRDRLLSFRRLRPDLPLPEEITLAPWAERVRDFEHLGVLSELLARCFEVGGEMLAASARRQFESLARSERRIMQEMVMGVGMDTIWERSGPSSSRG